MAYHRYSERSVILAPAQAAIKNPRKAGKVLLPIKHSEHIR